MLRTFTTRHGAGPLVTEDPVLCARLPDRHNRDHPWQGAFRVGHLDLVATRYALAATGGVDSLVVTHADAPDRLGREPRWCTEYRDEAGTPLSIAPGPAGDLDRQAALTRRLAGARPVLAPIPEEPAEAISRALGTPLAAVFSGPTRADARVVTERGRAVPGPSTRGRPGSGVWSARARPRVGPAWPA